MNKHKRRALIIGGGAVAGAAVGGVFTGAGPASADSFTVTNTDDAGAGSLRQAIIDANALPGLDVITFDAGVAGTITLTTGQLAVTDSVDIQGPGSAVLAVSGNATSRVFYLLNSADLLDVTLSGLTVQDGAADTGAGIKDQDENLVLADIVLTGNAATNRGGGLWLDGFAFSATVTDSVITGNSAANGGGGVYNEDTGGPLLFERTTITNNTSPRNGAGVYFYDPDDVVTFLDSTISDNVSGGVGGGIFLYDTDGGPFVIDHTTISGNTAIAGGGAYFYGPDDAVVITDSTISGNSAIEGRGGGIFVQYTEFDFTFSNTTVADNTATGGGGGIWMDRNPVTLRNTIVAGNSGGGSNPNDIGGGGGSEVLADFSLIGDVNTPAITGADNLFGVDPQLGPLQDNGGPTLTHMPAAGSPVIDAGDPAFVAPPADDQRGSTRIVGAAIDIGAVEAVGPPIGESYTTAEDTPLVVAPTGVLTNDPNGTNSTAVLATPPAHGVVGLAADGSFTYTPAANYNGPDSFTYVAQGPAAPNGTATVAIDVTPVNDPPVAGNTTANATDGAGPVNIDVLANATDPDGDSLVVTDVTQGTQGTVTFTAAGVVYTPNPGASGTDTFTYTISDGTLTATGTVNVTIAAAAPTTTTPPTTTPAAGAPVEPPPTDPATPAGELPATGSDPRPSAELAAGLLAAGLALTTVAGRRRRRLRRS